jgi:hypothetical protein
LTLLLPQVIPEAKEGDAKAPPSIEEAAAGQLAEDSGQRRPPVEQRVR